MASIGQFMGYLLWVTGSPTYYLSPMTYYLVTTSKLAIRVRDGAFFLCLP